MKKTVLRLLLTLAIGATGSFLAILAGLPAAALIGSAVFTSVAAIGGARLKIPDMLRNFAFLVIGCSLGTSLSPETLSEAGKWPLSLLMLTVAVALMMLSSGWVLVRYFGITKDTAVLATSPGALSYAMSLAASGIGDARAVMLLQGMRLLLVTTVLPIVLEVADLPHGGDNGAYSPVTMSLVMVGVTVGLALCVGLVFDRLRMPASFLIAGMAVSGITHAFSFIQGTMPPEVLTGAFVVTGSVVGTRFSGITWAEMKRLAIGASIGVMIASSIAALFAALTAHLLAMPFGQVWVAYAPGGVEAMAAMALALEYDPAFVAVHHVFRIVALIFTLPLILRLVGVKRT